jgi:hypothetical protein
MNGRYESDTWQRRWSPDFLPFSRLIATGVPRDMQHHFSIATEAKNAACILGTGARRMRLLLSISKTGSGNFDSGIRMRPAP